MKKKKHYKIIKNNHKIKNEPLPNNIEILQSKDEQLQSKNEQLQSNNEQLQNDKKSLQNNKELLQNSNKRPLQSDKYQLLVKKIQNIFKNKILSILMDNNNIEEKNIEENLDDIPKQNNSYNVFDDPRIGIEPLSKRRRDLLIKICKTERKNINDKLKFDIVGESKRKN